MAKYHPGKVNPIFIALLIPLVVIIAAAVFLVARNHMHSTTEPFSSSAYHHSPKELLGNHYNLDAQIESQLIWEEGFGRILAVKPMDGSERLSVFVPDKVGGDLVVGQRFHMKVLVKDAGLIQVEELEKY